MIVADLPQPTMPTAEKIELVTSLSIANSTRLGETSYDGYIESLWKYSYSETDLIKVIRTLRRWKESFRINKGIEVSTKTQLGNFFDFREASAISILMNAYHKEWERAVSKRKQDNLTLADKAFKSIYKKLIYLPFQDCAIEINSDESLKITLAFFEEKILMITKYPDTTFCEDDQVRYSFFINRKLIAADVIKLETLVEGFKKYIGM